MSELHKIIMQALLQNDLYSLEIVKAIKEISDRRVEVGSLYPMLHKLEKMGYIASYWGKDRPVERNGERRKYYRLTETGKEVLCPSESTYTLDPYLVGEVAGPAAFSPGDYVILTNNRNAPAKVRCRNDDILQSIRVILGDESDIMYAEANYYAADLGYPLTSGVVEPTSKRVVSTLPQRTMASTPLAT